MHTRFILGTILLTCMSAAGCSRADTDENARRATAELRDLATRARHQLSDSWLTTKIQAQYFADQDIKARNLNVSTRSGVVTISGRVENESVREQVLNIAKYTDGTRLIEDRLAVGPAEQASETVSVDVSPRPIATTGTTPAAVPPMDDPEVAARVQAKFFLDDAIKGRRIQVDVRDRVVTLHGAVATDNERAQALLLARTTEGVERVEDALTVNPALIPTSGIGSMPPQAAPPALQSADAALSDQVRSRFLADPQVKGAPLEVTARDGVLLIEGTVGSPAAKQRALSIARETEGVVQVVDRIKVKSEK